MARLLSFVVGGALLAGTVGLYVIAPDRLLESMFLSVFAVLIFGGAFVSDAGTARDGRHSLARIEQNAVFASLEETGSAIGAWVFALMLTALFGTLAHEIFTNPRHAAAPGWVKAMAVVLVLLAARAFVKACSKTLDVISFDRVQFSLPTSPATAGHALHGYIDIAKRIEDIRQISATLVCRETIWRQGFDTGTEKNKSTTEHWSTRGTFPLAAHGAGSRAEISFDIPADLPGTSHPGTFGLSGAFRHDVRYHEWWLQLDKPSRTFIIPVRGMPAAPEKKIGPSGRSSP